MDVFRPDNPIELAHQFVWCVAQEVCAVYSENNAFLVLSKVVLAQIVDSYLRVVLDLLVAPVLLPVLRKLELNKSDAW
jgi:hypothetical protein